MSEIKQINTGVAEIIAVKVPEGAYNFHVGNGIGDRPFLGYDHDSHRTFDIVELPPGKWKLLGIDTELTEEQAMEVIPLAENSSRFQRYLSNESFNSHIGYIDEGCDTAKEAFASLMQANGCYSDKPDECPNQWCEGGKIDIGYNEWLRCSLCEEIEDQVGTWLILNRLS